MRFAVAGTEPVEPATMIGASGRSRCRRSRFRLQQGVAALRRVARLALGQNAAASSRRDLHEVARDLEIVE